MSYKEKKTITTILSGLFILILYFINAINKIQENILLKDDLRFWAVTILTYIGIGVIVTIVIQIIFHILMSISIAIKEKIINGKVDDKEIERTLNHEMKEDEMDKLIGLKAMRVGFAIAGLGFFIALVSLVLEYSPVVMLNIIFLSFSFGSMIEGITQLIYYRRGIKNG